MLFMETVLFETRFEDGFAVDSAALAATMAKTGPGPSCSATPRTPPAASIRDPRSTKSRAPASSERSS